MRKKREFNANPYPYHHEVTLMVESITNLGMGVCRDEGWVVMVPFVLIGEKVKIRIFKNNKNYSEGDLVELIEPSKNRIEPKCEHFGTCGGCQYQHVNYSTQLLWKQNQVTELFSKLGKLEIQVSPTHGSPELFAYRSKLTPHYQKPIDGAYKNIGFLKFGRRHEIIDVPFCSIATKSINDKLTSLRIELQEKAKKTCATGKKKKGGTLLLRDTGEEVITNPKETGIEKVGDTLFQFKAGEFFQNNPYILPQLVAYVLDEVHASGNENLIDTYCGVGLFALSSRKLFKQSLGIEISEKSIEWARKNAALNQAENCKFILGSAEEIFDHVTFDPNHTSVIIDPPRKGCDLCFLEQLIHFGPSCLVYVSCDPATQARDSQFLTENGYELLKVQPFDLFPQTRHVESVATFRKSKNAEV